METVTHCSKLKDWTKDGKSVPIYKVDLSDGRSGESFGKEIPVGTPITDLIIEDTGKYGIKIKLNAPKGMGFKGAPKGNESFALSYAKDVYIAHLGIIGKELNSDTMFKLADKMYEWLENKKK